MKNHSVKNRSKLSRHMKNRLFYFGLLIFMAYTVLAYGGRMFQMTFAVLLLLLAASLTAAFVSLFGLRVEQQIEKTTVLKGASSRYLINVTNRSPFMCEQVVFRFTYDDFAVQTEKSLTDTRIHPFQTRAYEKHFSVHYRGMYALGLLFVETTDFLGLFTLRRRFKKTVPLMVYPRKTDVPHFPMAMNLLSQAQSNYEIKEEDYSTVSDIRPYEPTDSMKKIHWKLTAKRNEWMVKNFQSNALNSTVILLDTDKSLASHKTAIVLEDQMIEIVIAIIQFCLRMQKPVEFLYDVNGTTAEGFGESKRGRHWGDFDTLYYIAAELRFEGDPAKNRALQRLNQYLNDTTYYINLILVTARLDGALYERIVSANRFGHFIVVLYYAGDRPDPVSEDIFRKLTDSSVVCFRNFSA